MKTMKKGDEIVRVEESKQFDFLKRGYSYIPKSEWKKTIRDVKITKKSDEQDEKESTPKKITRRGKNSKKDQ